jgi:hypothetical protein
VVLAAGQARPSLAQLLAQQMGQKTFPSAEAASSAVYSAVQHNDERAVMTILGGGKELVSTDDAVLDKLEREHFVQKYREMHRLVVQSDGSTVLYIGAENWPFPIPLVSVNGAWHFHSEMGAMEVLFRRIGANEITTIEACHALVSAENQPGARNETDNFIGALLAGGDKNPVPFHGYYFRILTSAGKNAPGEAKSQIRKGRLPGGYAVIAYPAAYRSSGVMTFIVNRDNVVYEKDLGPKTATLARAMTEYQPGPTWTPVEMAP